MKAQKLFAFAFIFGLICICASVGGVFLENSPYRYGTEGGRWWITQLAAGAALIYAGAMGSLAAVTGGQLRPGRPWVGIMSVLITMVLLVASVVLAHVSPDARFSPTTADRIAIFGAMASTVFALTIGALALYYLGWQQLFQWRAKRRD